MAKQITVECRQELAGIMIDALNWFVAEHYPSGADECSIAARDALFGLAHHFEQVLQAEGHCTYSIRMRAFLSEAIRSYFEQLAVQRGEQTSNRTRVLIAVCRGDSNGADFEEAAVLDAAALPGPE